MYSFITASAIISKPVPRCLKGNEVYKSSGTFCPRTCDNYNQQTLVCIQQSVAGCYCTDGFVRNTADGSCVLPSQCPGKSFKIYLRQRLQHLTVIFLAKLVTCPLNEVYTTCGSACPDTCDNYKDTSRMCTMQCVIGCQCRSGYVRNNVDGKCCLRDQCPGKNSKKSTQYPFFNYFVPTILNKLLRRNLNRIPNQLVAHWTRFTTLAVLLVLLHAKITTILPCAQWIAR